MLLDSKTGSSSSAECQNGTEAIDAIQDRQPDLVFLDVQMPGATGFEVIEAVGAEHMPLVVFVTAYDQYALRAFDVRALDYLLKPFDRERFQQALSRARQRVGTSTRRSRTPAARAGAGSQADAAPGRSLRGQVGRPRLFRPGRGNRLDRIGRQLREAARRRRDAPAARNHDRDREAQLDPEAFFRIHRCHIVNIERVRELQPWFNGEYVVFLKNGARLTLSRGYREKFQQRLGGAL